MGKFTQGGLGKSAHVFDMGLVHLQLIKSTEMKNDLDHTFK
tara:strand:+ start:30006 stop:30128 length:123 start_codon:yes stop_codon:yes gene_type:complete